MTRQAGSERSIPVLKIAAVYIGTVVGAGFASGQEILQFFGYFGLWGVAGLVVATFLFGFLGVRVMLIARQNRISSFQQLVALIGGPHLGPLINFAITFFLLGIVTAMVAGTGAVFAQEFGWPVSAGAALMAGLAGATVIAGITGVIDAISYVVPFLIVFVLGMGGYILSAAPLDLTWSSPLSAALPCWYLSGLTYVSYNFVFAVPLLVPMSMFARPRAIKQGVLLGALGLGVCALVILAMLLNAAPPVVGFEIPMLFVAGRVSPFIRLTYTFILVAEIYTTAIGCLYGFVSRLFAMGGPRLRSFTGCVAIAVFFAGQLGFSEIVATVYPLSGLAGFLFIAALLYYRPHRNNGRVRFFRGIKF